MTGCINISSEAKKLGFTDFSLFSKRLAVCRFFGCNGLIFQFRSTQPTIVTVYSFYC